MFKLDGDKKTTNIWFTTGHEWVKKTNRQFHKLKEKFRLVTFKRVSTSLVCPCNKTHTSHVYKAFTVNTSAISAPLKTHLSFLTYVKLKYSRAAAS